VHKSGAVGTRKSVGDLDGIFNREIGRQSARRDEFVERLSGEMLHNHAFEAVLCADVVNDADVGMLQS
jgi:hypothetical protein